MRNRILKISCLLTLVITMGFSNHYYDEESYINEVAIAIDNAHYLSIDEKDMMKEINTVRVNPKLYLTYVEELLEVTEKDSVKLSNVISESIKKRVVYEASGAVVTIDTIYNNYYQSRISAIRELAKELEITTPKRPLLPHKALFSAAYNHGQNQVPNNYIAHQGMDGTWPFDRIHREAPWAVDGNENIVSGIGSVRDIVLQLLIDSGVEKRGHRKNILDPKWKYFTCHNVEDLNVYDYKWWIQEFAY